MMRCRHHIYEEDHQREMPRHGRQEYPDQQRPNESSLRYNAKEGRDKIGRRKIMGPQRSSQGLVYIRRACRERDEASRGTLSTKTDILLILAMDPFGRSDLLSPFLR
jgi:hypothetical protein